MENNMEVPQRTEILSCHVNQQSHSWDISKKKPTTQKDICTPKFMVALFTIAKTWKQSKCPLTDKWIKKMWCIYGMEYCHKKKSEMMPFTATWMQLKIITLNEVSQKEKDKCHMISLMCGIYSVAQMNLSTEQRQTHSHGEQTRGCQGRRGRE
uniref:DUF1725 domain-containing protein n=1 Tax=Sus scrofa TaxID=9823 RepID=A0A8D1W4W1_PIG